MDNIRGRNSAFAFLGDTLAVTFSSGLGWPLVEKLVGEGTIHPRLSFNAARALLAEYFPETLKRNPPSSFNKRFE